VDGIFTLLLSFGGSPLYVQKSQQISFEIIGSGSINFDAMNFAALGKICWLWALKDSLYVAET